jgi:hypothetical protein
MKKATTIEEGSCSRIARPPKALDRRAQCRPSSTVSPERKGVGEIDGLLEQTITERMKVKLCLQWLNFCESIGWPKRDLPYLADIFWSHQGWKTFRGRPV